MRRPTITVRLGRDDTRRAVVLRIQITERVALAPVASAALLGATVLCAADARPTVAGVSLVGCGMLAVALALVARILRV